MPCLIDGLILICEIYEKGRKGESMRNNGHKTVIYDITWLFVDLR